MIMNRLAFIAFFVLSLFSSLAHAETIDIQIKGFDDGVKTTRQQDLDLFADFSGTED